MDGSCNNDSDPEHDQRGHKSKSSDAMAQTTSVACNGVSPMQQAEQVTGTSAGSANPQFGSASIPPPPMTSTYGPSANQMAQVGGQRPAEENNKCPGTLSSSSLATFTSLLSTTTPKESSRPSARKTLDLRGPNTMDDTEFVLSSALHSPTAPSLSTVPFQLPVASPPQYPRKQRPLVWEEILKNEASITRVIPSPLPYLSPTPMVSAVKRPPSLSANETPHAWEHHRISDASERTISPLLAFLEKHPEYLTEARSSSNKSLTMRSRDSVSSAPFYPPGFTEAPEILLDNSSVSSAPLSPPFGARKVSDRQADFRTSTPGCLPPPRTNKGPKVASVDTPKLTVDGAAATTSCADRNTGEKKSSTPSLSSLSALGGPSRHDCAAAPTLNAVRTPDASIRDMTVGQQARGKHSDSPLFNYGRENKENLLGYLAIALTVLLFCVLLTVMVNFLLPPDKPDLICTTAPCQALDALLTGSLDSGREPCDNFYEHICGGWAQVQNVSVYQNHLRDFIRDIHGVLSGIQVPAHMQTAAQMVAAFYQSCTVVVVDGAHELPKFRARLEHAGLAWPKVLPSSDLALTAAQVHRDFQITALLRIRRVAGKDAGGLLEIAPDQGFLGTWQKTRDQLLRNGAYERFFEETKYLYADNGSIRGSEFKYREFLKTESLILDSLADKSLFRNTVVMESVNALPVVVNISVASWLMVTKKLGLPANVKVVITNIEHLSRVGKLVNTLSEPYLHYYFGWYVVQQMRRYIDKALADSWYNFAATYLGADDSGDRRADCIELVESVVGRLAFESFILSSVDAGDEAYVTSMAAALSQDFTQKVVISGARNNLSIAPPLGTSQFQVDFHGDIMRVVKEALVKSNLTDHTSLLSNWMDIVGAMSEMNTALRGSVPTTYIHDLSESERYSLFDDRSAALSVPPLFSMLPVYERRLTDGAKFGALGTLLAPAIIRVFLARLPSYSLFRREITRGLRCFSDSAESLYNNTDFILPVASAEVAMSALRNLPRSDRLRLRTFDRLQTFFAVMCYLLCAPIGSRGSLIAEAICNEAVKNSDIFPLAFQCPLDSAMNPSVKCHMFK